MSEGFDWHNPSPPPGRRFCDGEIDDLTPLRTDARPGDWALWNTEEGLHLAVVLPLPPGYPEAAKALCVHALPIRPARNVKKPSWEWDGNREAPTLTPSIRAGFSWGGCERAHWHGYLKAGRLEGWWEGPSLDHLAETST